MKNTVDSIVQAFEQLTPESVERLDTLYAAHARFKDPFNDVRGLAEIQRIFRHMYVSLESPRFIITHRIVEGHQCFLTWEFRFRFRRFHQGVEQVVLGGSHLMLNPDGRIILHRDYWDAAEELYEKIPYLGGLMRWLKKRANA
ncbi:nuclear transport factor 2 family protein [Rhodoferax sp.]|uniref:nuclear transport factor 2 family protein n=1 Tax=Rhodoferax sp. TaxID=50421 RepID=UPI001EB2EF01|nr:nuclear transport factor 2 family protein [Rhodoferax sp.]MBT9505138.1 nuclear transport factor 2 family protein [Rhodoferax sp.]